MFFFLSPLILLLCDEAAQLTIKDCLPCHHKMTQRFLILTREAAYNILTDITRITEYLIIVNSIIMAIHMVSSTPDVIT